MFNNAKGMRLAALEDYGQPVQPTQTPITDAPAGGQVTGGNYPSSPTTPGQITGGNYPSTPTVPGQITGGNYPSTPTPPAGGGQVTGGNYPSRPTGTTWTQPPVPPQDPSQPVQPPVTQGTQQPQGGFSPANVATDTMSQILNPDGTYLRNARMRGLEAAASRGNRAGGSIAAGAAERAAIEAAQPMFQQAMGLHGQRENNAFTGEQNRLERNRDYTQAQLQDWMNSNSFSREFYGALTMMPINSAYQLNSMIQSYALENPDIYTADVISGMTNFFTQNFSQLLGTYFPGLYGAGNGAGAGGGG